MVCSSSSLARWIHFSRHYLLDDLPGVGKVTGERLEKLGIRTVKLLPGHEYHWKAAIRELQNLVERAVIVSQDGVLPNPLHKKQTEFMVPSLHHTRTFPSSMTLEDSDRALITETLEKAGWIVGGPRGAAAKLGLKRTTLLAKMRRIGDFTTYPSGGNRRERYSTWDDMMARCSVVKFVRARLEGASAADLVKSMQARAQKEKSYEEHRDLAQVVRAQRMARDWTRQHFPRLPIPLQVESP